MNSCSIKFVIHFDTTRSLLSFISVGSFFFVNREDLFTSKNLSLFLFFYTSPFWIHFSISSSRLWILIFYETNSFFYILNFDFFVYFLFFVCFLFVSPSWFCLSGRVLKLQKKMKSQHGRSNVAGEVLKVLLVSYFCPQLLARVGWLFSRSIFTPKWLVLRFWLYHFKTHNLGFKY